MTGYVLDHLALTAGLTEQGDQHQRRELSHLVHDALEGGPPVAVPAICLAAATASVAADAAARAVARAGASGASPAAASVLAEAAAAVAAAGTRPLLAAHIAELIATGQPGVIEVSELTRTPELDRLRDSFPRLDWPAVHAVLVAQAADRAVLTTSPDTYAGVRVQIIEL